MNKLRLFLPRFVFALVLAVGTFGVSVTTAQADKPTKTQLPPITFSPSVLTDVCSFSVNIEPTVGGTQTLFVDTGGNLIRQRFHFVEQDTFTANGKTLVGIPFTFNLEFLFDSSGNLLQFYADGIVEKIPLPDGSLFISAGRVDWTAHPGVDWILSADNGNPGNVAGFCAALSG